MSNELLGRPASGGFASGKPVIIDNADDFQSFQNGDVLVVIETDISYIPIMQQAAGIITERGGRFCHAAVWARENNKPTIVGAINATKALEGVSQVKIDANIGKIEWE